MRSEKVCDFPVIKYCPSGESLSDLTNNFNHLCPITPCNPRGGAVHFSHQHPIPHPNVTRNPPAREIYANDSEAYLTGVLVPGSEQNQKKPS